MVVRMVYASLDDNTIPVYGVCIHLSPKHKPNLQKYILWTELVHWTNPCRYLYGSF